MAKKTIQELITHDYRTDRLSSKVIPEVTTFSDPSDIAPAFDLHPGKTHFVRIDPAGNEIPGSDFQVGHTTAHVYENLPTQFRQKKSLTK